MAVIWDSNAKAKEKTTVDNSAPETLDGVREVIAFFVGVGFY